ncbi:MAG: DUF4275 family protein [Firmicutes bacterium]|nr:DUF4275 family protein [Bacillota bacterium]MBQ9972881.1 DUF4275 family protein [Bacillota bacterium]
MSVLNEKDIFKKYIKAFASGVSDEFMQEHVLAPGNYLWHLFSWEGVPCLKGDEARAAFDALEFDRAIMFEAGFTHIEMHGGMVMTAKATAMENLRFCDKVSAAELEECDDTYVIAEDFSWTYVHTHEEMCGPYFLKVK